MIILLCILAYGAVSVAVAYALGRLGWREPNDPVFEVSLFWPLAAAILPLLGLIALIVWASEKGWKA